MLIFASITDNRPGPPRLVIDDDLMIRVAEGDQEAFSTLYTLAGKSIYAYALSILKNPEDAEDILQDTFLKVRSAASLYQSPGNVLAWILTISRNLCLMKLRRRKFISSQPLEELSVTSTFHQIGDLEDRIVLQTALQCLSEEECQIIILHAVTGWKHREIAELLHLPVPTILSKYHRGIKKLKAKLEGKL